MSRDAASPDPFAEVSLAEYARRLRQRKVSIERTVAIYLARIEQLDPKLGAYEHVSATQALDRRACTGRSARRRR
jgi:aspartyl-tRNA(Asn)/glutamyl-tRNA(Gln) amidotransferase subunit A